MEHVTLNGAALEYEVRGTGDPLLLIHGAILADAFFPLLHEPALARHYCLISYHRRGFAGSARPPAPFSIAQQAADGRALLHHLGTPRAHIAGHSYGAITALQLVLDAPDAMQSLALLEPVVLEAIPSGPAFGEGLAPIIGMYERGEKVGALEGFLTAVVGTAYRQVIDTVLPPARLSWPLPIWTPSSRSNCRRCKRGGLPGPRRSASASPWCRSWAATLRPFSGRPTHCSCSGCPTRRSW